LVFIGVDVKEVILSKGTPGEVIEIVREMRANGMIQGKDFDFKYMPVKYDTNGWEVVTEQHTVFTFYEESYATWFALKWA